MSGQEPMTAARRAEIVARVGAVEPVALPPLAPLDDEFVVGVACALNAHYAAPTDRAGSAEMAVFEARALCATAPIAALRAELAAARARVWELERPEIERQRGEIVQSFRELAAQSRGDHDFESEAVVLQRLADREAQWAARDAEARRALAGGGEQRG